MKIALDLDGVVSDFDSGMKFYLHNSKGFSLPETEPTDWDWWKCPDFNISKEHFEEAFQEYWDQNLFALQKNYPEAEEAVKQMINAGHEVHFFTHRPESTHIWVSSDGNYRVDITYCIGAKDKAQQVARWGADIFVDDKPENCEAVHDILPRRAVFLYARPYNVNYVKSKSSYRNSIRFVYAWDYLLYYVGTELYDKTISPSSRFEELLDKMKDIYKRKNHDYSGEGEDPFSNFRECEDFNVPAWKGVLVRLGDKYSRLKNFAKKETLAVSDETIIDTLIDNANYSLIAAILIEEMSAAKK